ncbi:class I SAM-dependent methyltransferase [Vreelandella alkaliphila]|uniref:class I SAM-dependent methyltransferase n=1 Tax=Vreelandella alkaliphila TaxID=272774 RepID=UPI0039F4C3BA
MERKTVEVLFENFSRQFVNNNNQLEENLKIKIDQLYTQLESLSWLQSSLSLKGSLPPLRGWPVSPDFLLMLHSWIKKNKPKVIVEMGSGASTLVIADALRQNNSGFLFSFEHLKKYGNQTWKSLVDEQLTSWVDLRICELSSWNRDHLNPPESKTPSRWYSSNFEGISDIDILIVDGPPGTVCSYSRYPALPAFIDRLSVNAEIWLDDANRQDEKDIFKRWAELYAFDVEYVPLEKGLAKLTRSSRYPTDSYSKSVMNTFKIGNEDFEHTLGLNFSLPEK